MADVLQLEAQAETELGSWRLVAPLGAGGMGQVYLAEHRELGRKAAIKVLHPQLAGDPDLVRRFFAEARVVNEIDHEHIVEIHDFVVDPRGRSYFVMELLHGRSLADTSLHEGLLPLARLVAIARQICSALQAAHAKGVVHRDLKPENVMLVERAGRRDFVKLLDFGIAKVPTAGPNAVNTLTGMILGTPEYMSPEQAGGRAVDTRSDIYSFGVLLYWMIAGTVPFKASGFDKLILLRLTTEPPRLPSVTPSGERLPRSLAKLVGRCLAKEPADRFQTVAEVDAALELLAPELTTPARSLKRARVAWAVSAALGLTGAMALWTGLRGSSARAAGEGGSDVAAAASPPAALEARAHDPLPPPPQPPVREAHRTPSKRASRRPARRAASDLNAIVNPYEQ
ncbi:MAG: serine/threonine-protein kinase [Myxococcales bacterium]